MFEGVLTSIGQKKAFGGFGRDIVELTVFDAAEIARVTDAVTDVNGGRLESDVAELADRLPTVGTFKSHLPDSSLERAGRPP
jgi:hypothetical protein